MKPSKNGWLFYKFLLITNYMVKTKKATEISAAFLHTINLFV